MNVPIAYYLVLSGILFTIGVAAFLIKRNIITVFMSIELMLNAVNLTFVAFAHQWHQVSGQIFVFFVMVVLQPLKQRGSCDYHCHLPHPEHARYRQREPDETMNGASLQLHLWLIPLIPFVGFLLNGLLAASCRRRWCRPSRWWPLRFPLPWPSMRGRTSMRFPCPTSRSSRHHGSRPRPSMPASPCRLTS